LPKFDRLEKEKMCAQCVSLWGITAQMFMVIEECLELALSVCRFYRGRATKDDVASEIADVNIMNMQLSHIIGLSDEDVSKWEIKKLERLKERIEFDMERKKNRGKE